MFFNLRLLSCFTMSGLSFNSCAAAIEGYLSHYSILPGQTFSLFTSTGAENFNVAVHKAGEVDELMANYFNVPGKLQQIPEQSWSAGARWQPSLSFKIPEHWHSGIYTITLSTSNDTKLLNFVVKPSEPATQSSILLLDNATTQAAYNNWGGKSLYEHNSNEGRARKVSLFRPRQNGSSKKELRFVRWADHMGIAIEHASQLDLHYDPQLLSHYQTLVITGHSEYWSKEMRQHFDTFIANGGNAVILSGNTMWWQVRIEDGQLVCYKNADQDPMSQIDPSQVTDLFHRAPVNNPENNSIGLSFRNGGYVNYGEHYPAEEGYGGYEISLAAHRFLAGTGLLNGDQLGLEVTIVGYEADGALFELKDGLPKVTGEDQTPSNFTILGVSPASNGHATMGTFSAGENSGKVFNAGTIDWVDGLWLPSDGKVPDPMVSKITLNVLSEFSPDNAANCATDISTIDTDEDGIFDVCDNCINTANSDQHDFDGDLTGDACDIDDDNDGTPDINDSHPLDPNDGRGEPNNPSSTTPAQSGGGSISWLLLFVIALWRRKQG